jgi:methylphosphotriester-DNA--protein-cysteine methyltransferase
VPQATIVVTLLDPGLSSIIDRSAAGEFAIIVASSLNEAAQVAWRVSACAVLLSPLLMQEEPTSTTRQLLAKLPGVSLVAVLGEDWASSYTSLLRLGACGVHHTVNLCQREGWNELRAIIRDAGQEATQAITRRLLTSMGKASDQARGFAGLLVRYAPMSPSVRILCQALRVNSSTLGSRFFRARLPTPKMYLSMTRLLYAVRYFENENTSVSFVANALHYSSPQSFGRHIRTLLGVTAVEFRKAFDFDRACEHFEQRLIVPFEETLATFDPVGTGAILPVHRYRPTKDLVLVAAERQHTQTPSAS